MTERRLVRKDDLSLRFGTTVLTIPVNGGSASKTFNVSGFHEIEFILNCRITSTSPKVSDVYAPQVWFVTGTSIVGISLGGATGTSVTAEVACLGY